MQRVGPRKHAVRLHKRLGQLLELLAADVDRARHLRAVRTQKRTRSAKTKVRIAHFFVCNKSDRLSVLYLSLLEPLDGIAAVLVVLLEELQEILTWQAMLGKLREALRRSMLEHAVLYVLWK